MSSPFEQLGINRSFAKSLSCSGGLEKFLKEHYRKLQHYVHPDKCGIGSPALDAVANTLSAAVNSAFAEITDHPDKLESWLADEDAEYLQLIAGLSEKLERLQGVEREYNHIDQVQPKNKGILFQLFFLS